MISTGQAFFDFYHFLPPIKVTIMLAGRARQLDYDLFRDGGRFGATDYRRGAE